MESIEAANKVPGAKARVTAMHLEE